MTNNLRRFLFVFLEHGRVEQQVTCNWKVQTRNQELVLTTQENVAVVLRKADIVQEQVSVRLCTLRLTCFFYYYLSS